MKRRYLDIVLLGACVTAFVLGGAAQDKGKDLRTAVDHVDRAATVISEVMGVPETSIPRDLLDKAQAVVIFPGVIKAAFVFGGQGGSGVVVRRQGTGWSAPAFLKIGGGSV